MEQMFFFLFSIIVLLGTVCCYAPNRYAGKNGIQSQFIGIGLAEHGEKALDPGYSSFYLSLPENFVPLTLKRNQRYQTLNATNTNTEMKTLFLFSLDRFGQ